MGRYLLHVASSAAPGEDEEYNRWYDETHLAEVTALEWVCSGRRLKRIGPDGPRYLAVYEVEVDDPTMIVPMLREAGPKMKMTTAIDPSSVSFAVYEHHGEAQ